MSAVNAGTTVTREIWRTTFNGGWMDRARFRDRDTPSVVQQAIMSIGEPLDRDTFLAHIRLGNDGVTMKDGCVDHYFECEDILLDVMDLWSKDCTFHTVQDVKITWDKREIPDGPQSAAV
jgi:hypothetical protein